jgi:hypothetical protein
MAEQEPDELTRAAMVGVVARWNLAYKEAEYQKRVRDEAANKLEEANKVIASCKAACTAFGYNRDNAEQWDYVMSHFAQEAVALYNRTKPAYLPEVLFPQAPQLSAPDDKLPVIEEVAVERPPVRSLVLERLLAVFPNGIKASEIRDYIQETYPASGELHEKTVGMTLYRLFKDGLARRDGRMWFSVKPQGGTKNPGGETPGPSELFK